MHRLFSSHKAMSSIAILIFSFIFCGYGYSPFSSLVKAQTSVNSAPWYNSSWLHRKKITIDGTKVSGAAALVNFPVVISGGDPDWRSSGNGGYVGKRDGTDIMFTAADGTTRLDHEIEAYIETTGELVAWVKLPSLIPGNNTDIYIYYGNATAAVQQNRTGVWESTYRGVWHLHTANPSATGAIDSTANRNNGSPVGAIQQYTGQMDGSFDFTASSNYLQHGNRSSLQLTGAMTLSAWVNPRTYPEVGQIIGKEGNNGARGWTIRLDSYGGINFNVARDANTVANLYSSELPPNTWSFVTAVYEPGTAMRIYINGVLDAERTSDVPVSQYNNSNSVLMGKRAGCLPCEIDSRLDEVRVLAVDRNADWIRTEYHNQSSPRTFYTVGQQEGKGFEVVNLLANPSVELDANGDTRPDKWTSNSKFTRSSDEVVPHHGTYVGKFFASDDLGVTIGQVVPNVIAGTTYTISGWLNIPAQNDTTFSFRLQVRWRDANNTTISTSTVGSSTTATSGWIQATKNLVAPAGTTNAQVQLVASSLNGTIYVDDFTFQQ